MPVVGLHLDHFKRNAIAAIDKHNRRLTVVRTNEIDASLSNRNITIIPPERGTLYQTVKKYEDRAKEKGYRLRKDTNYITGIIVTCPREFLNNDDLFLHYALSYLVEKVPCPCVEAVIHHDEHGLPHLHATFVNVTPDGRFSSRELFPRSFLVSLHDDLPAFMHERGFEVQRPDGKQTRSRGNLHYSEFKAEMEKQKLELVEDYNQLVRKYNVLAGEYEHLEKILAKTKNRNIDIDR